MKITLANLLFLLVFIIASLPVQARDLPVAPVAGQGMLVKASHYSVAETLDRLEKIVTGKGITVFARVDHGSGAKKVDIPLRPTQLLIFGNPKLGAPLMQNQQTIGIDLPLKALAWEDAEGKVWLGYNQPSYIAARHSVTEPQKIIDKMSGALKKFTDYATGQ